MGTNNKTRAILRQGPIAVLIAVLGWATVASMMVAQDHAVVSAPMLLPTGLSVGLIGAFLTAPALVYGQRKRAAAAGEPSHIHVQRPSREYFSPYTCCPPGDESRS